MMMCWPALEAWWPGRLKKWPVMMMMMINGIEGDDHDELLTVFCVDKCVSGHYNGMPLYHLTSILMIHCDIDDSLWFILLNLLHDWLAIMMTYIGVLTVLMPFLICGSILPIRLMKWRKWWCLLMPWNIVVLYYCYSIMWWYQWWCH